MTREQAYDLVQPKTAYSWDNQVDFKPLLEADPEVTSRLTQEEIDEIFNPVYYTKRVDDIFESSWFRIIKIKSKFYYSIHWSRRTSVFLVY